MGDDNPVERFHELRQQYDEKHGRGAALDVKDELELGSGTFNDQLTVDEVEELADELALRLAATP